MQEDGAKQTHLAESSASDFHKEVEIGRRSLVGALLGAGALLIGAIVGSPLFQFVLYPVYAKSSNDEWSDVGDLKEFDVLDAPASKTIRFVQRDGWREVVSSESVYVHRSSNNQLRVMSAICPHLGCSVAWHPDQQKFVCPCHGGQFKPDGEHISGPPPRRLDCLQTRIAQGRLQVRFEFFRSNTPKQESVG